MENTSILANGLLLKIPDAARMLAVGRSTIYELIATGDLETVHIGRVVRLTTASTETLVERLTAEGPHRQRDAT